jgi:molecular chaperone Hsp33
MKTNADLLQHFLFEDFLFENSTIEKQLNQPMPIRGNIVHLNNTFEQVLQHQNLPKVLKLALGELMAASALLSATLKMDGVMVLQLTGKGALKLLVVECSHDLNMRATAKWDETLSNEMETLSFVELVKHGQFVITLDPSVGEAYQGVVPIEGSTIAEILQNYMLRSQQIATSLWLHCDGESASGMLLQKLPNLGEADADAWNRMNILAGTVTNDELKNLAPESLLSRLFSEENVRLFEAKPTRFRCRCSKAKVGNMLRLLGAQEVESILAELGKIDVNCDFCNKQYAFDALDISHAFSENAVFVENKTNH